MTHESSVDARNVGQLVLCRHEHGELDKERNERDDTCDDGEENCQDARLLEGEQARLGRPEVLWRANEREENASGQDCS